MSRIKMLGELPVKARSLAIFGPGRLVFHSGDESEATVRLCLDRVEECRASDRRLGDRAGSKGREYAESDFDAVKAALEALLPVRVPEVES